MKLKKTFAVVVAAAALIAAACGDKGPSAEDADRVVEVSMKDNAFDPNSLSVKSGETVTFKFTNDGAVDHDAFIGGADAQEEHGESMDSGEMEGHNMDDGDSLLLEPGKSGELTHTFEDSGEVLIGCHQPGHYEAGMKSTITVS
ncbi:MAG TPA: cupredoxin domain-containing protein [Actinomycetota bacterium]|jgi:uncharacterized cupredoxin-like copper-binding protein|nr:cupredoxin domain-containing protein [Actinomycetota bacterium]